jgi:protein gp37
VCRQSLRALRRQPQKFIPELLATSLFVRGVSAEPLLGPVDFRAVTMADGDTLGSDLFRHFTGSWIERVIVGGESGPHARPMHLDWVLGQKLARPMPDRMHSVLLQAEP